MTAIAHQLPRENGKVICIANIKGACCEKNCKFWHGDMKKAAQLKKFGPLIDFVCRCTGEKDLDRKSPNTPRSFGSGSHEDSYMERYLGSGSWKGKKVRKTCVLEIRRTTATRFARR